MTDLVGLAYVATADEVDITKVKDLHRRDIGVHSDIASISITDSNINYIRTSGYASAGDGGHALYRRVASQPSHQHRAQSAEGTWWEGVPDNGEIDIRCLGAVADWDGSTGTQNKTAIDSAYAAASSLACGLVGSGRFRCDGAVATGVPLRGVNLSLESSAAGTNILNLADDSVVDGVDFVGQNFGTSGSTTVDNGVFGSGVSRVVVKNCTFDKFGNVTNYGAGAIQFAGTCDDLRVQDNRITGGVGTGTAADINFYNNSMSDIFCTGNYCLSENRQGIAFQIGGAQAGRRVISGNICSNHTAHGMALLYGDTDSVFLDTICSGNICYNNLGTGIYLASGTAGGGSVSIVDNIVSYCGGDGDIGADLEGGIVTSGDMPIYIANNQVSWTGYDTAQADRTDDVPGINAIGLQAHIVNNLIHRATGAGIHSEQATTRELIADGNRLYGCDIHIELSTDVDLVEVSNNFIDNRDFDRRGIYVQHTTAHGKDKIRYHNNTLYGSKSGTSTIGFDFTFGFVGEFTSNKIYNWDIGHDLGDDTSVDYWDGFQCFWANNIYEDNTTGVKFNQTTDANGPLIGLNNIFRSNTTDIDDVADASLYHAQAIGDGRVSVWGSAIPTFGTWAAGSVVWNNAPATGQPIGWMCRTAGSPGTWTAMANL